MAETLCIQATTLKEIIDAIEASGCVTIRIQMSPPNAEEYIIARETLVKVADEVRAFDGTTAEILVAELATRILALAEDVPNEPTIIKLATPIIALYDENGIIEPEQPPVSGNTTAILGEAILGLAILGNSGNTVKLATPIIRLYDDSTGEPDVPIIKLATPIIALYNDSVVEPDEPDVPDEPTIEKLATPIIALYEEAEVTVKQLGTTVIYLEEVAEETVVQLATPVIYLDEEGKVKQLGTTTIYLEEVAEETVVQLATPVIYLEKEN